MIFFGLNFISDKDENFNLKLDNHKFQMNFNDDNNIDEIFYQLVKKVSQELKLIRKEYNDESIVAELHLNNTNLEGVVSLGIINPEGIMLNNDSGLILVSNLISQFIKILSHPPKQTIDNKKIVWN